MNDELKRIPWKGSDDIHREVYAALIAPDQQRDFIYSKVGEGDDCVFISYRRAGAVVRPGTYSFKLVAVPQVRYPEAKASGHRMKLEQEGKLQFASSSSYMSPDNARAARWLTKRFIEHGAAPLQINVQARGLFEAEKCRFQTIHFDGRINVEDGDRFSIWYSHGVGKARAYGFGMILLHNDN